MHTVVIGGGLAGLVTAWHATQRGESVVVLEASDRAGGTMQTVTHRGARLEAGPQSFRHGSIEAVTLLEGLGLKDQVVLANKTSRRRFVLRDGRLHLLGANTLTTGKPVSRRTIARVLAEPLVPRRTATSPESVHSFLARRMGPGAARELGDPIMAGIFGGDPKNLEVASAFPPFHKLERDFGGLVVGMMRRPKPVLPDWAPNTGFALAGGMQTLVDALAAAAGDAVRLNTPVTSVSKEGAGWTVVAGGERLSANKVVVTAPPWAARRFVPAELVGHLDGIPGAPIAAVHLGWPSTEVPDPNGFGWLAPSHERRDVLGAIWPTSMFPDQQPGHTLVRVMLGGSRDPHALFESDEALIARCRRALTEVQGITATPSLVHVARHPHGIPQYVLGHQRRLAALRASGLRFVGWGYTGIGINHTIEAVLRDGATD